MSTLITWHSPVMIKSDSPAVRHPKPNKQKGTVTVVVPQPFASDALFNAQFLLHCSEMEMLRNPILSKAKAESQHTRVP